MDTTTSATEVMRPEVMRAVVSRSYGPPDSLTIEEVAKPVPRPNEVLVRNRASVVTAAVVAARRGPLMARLYFGLTKPTWPVLGTNFAGIVEAVGSQATRFSVGDLPPRTGRGGRTHPVHRAEPPDGGGRRIPPARGDRAQGRKRRHHPGQLTPQAAVGAPALANSASTSLALKMWSAVMRARPATPASSPRSDVLITRLRVASG